MAFAIAKRDSVVDLRAIGAPAHRASSSIPIKGSSTLSSPLAGIRHGLPTAPEHAPLSSALCRFSGRGASRATADTFIASEHHEARSAHHARPLLSSVATPSLGASASNRTEAPGEGVARYVEELPALLARFLFPVSGAVRRQPACPLSPCSHTWIVPREHEYHAIAEARIAHARGETPADAEQPALDFGVSA